MNNTCGLLLKAFDTADKQWTINGEIFTAMMRHGQVLHESFCLSDELSTRTSTTIDQFKKNVKAIHGFKVGTSSSYDQ